MEVMVHGNPVVGFMRHLEEARSLDGAVRVVEPTVRALFGSGSRGALLRGDWLGHAVHPVLTDVVLGTWTSATLLDIAGGVDSRKAAQRLVAAGILAAPLTAWTGWAEWSASSSRDKRVGLVHAGTVAVAIGAQAASWSSRRRGDVRTGAGLGMIGMVVAGLGGYLGGHLAAARNVGSRHPVFAET